MPESLETQKSNLEAKLHSIKDRDIRSAIEVQIATLNRKILSKGSRKAVLPDGARVGIGDTVFSYTVPRVALNWHGGIDSRSPGEIKRQVITAISPDASQLAFGEQDRRNGRRSYQRATDYFGSEESARAVMIVQSDRIVTRAADELTVAQRRLVAAQESAQAAREDDYGAAWAAGKKSLKATREDVLAIPRVSQ